jgi:CRP-like cAMP-binding protein
MRSRWESELAMNMIAALNDESVSKLPCTGCEDRDCPIRNALGDAGLKRCAGAIRQISARPGERIEISGYQQDTVFRVASGMLMQEHVLGDGRRHVSAFKTDGEIAWPLSNGSMGEIREFYEAVKPSDICVISVDSLAEATSHPAELMETLYSAAKDEVARDQTRMLTLARSSAAERLAGFLVDLAGRTGRQTRRGIELKLNMRRERIADHLGMQPETISRIMSTFKKDGVIQLPRPTVVIIPDIRTLANIAYGTS